MPTSTLHEPKARSALSNRSHADRLYDFCVAAEERSRQLAVDGEKDRAQWKTGIYDYESGTELGVRMTTGEWEKEHKRASPEAAVETTSTRLFEGLEAEGAGLSENMHRCAIDNTLTARADIWGNILIRRMGNRLAPKPRRYASPPPEHAERDREQRRSRL